MKFDTIIIGGGNSGLKVALGLLKAGQKTALIAAGRSVGEVDLHPYESAGGTLLMGDSVTGGIFDGDSLKAVTTANFGDYPLYADAFVIATGKFLGKGLVADMSRVYEPVFGLDVEYDPDRSRWFNPSFSEPQPFMKFGVKVDSAFRPSIGGRTVSNLFACGELLAGVSSLDGYDALESSSDSVLNNILKLKGHAGE